ncbi:MAG TPA: glycosyltransferase, partial [Pyrinomonadaceae bacterium]|nr:glycosyltransferase [Pyrinomonadaceae bacterium]
MISSLSSGGAERVLTLLAQGLAQRGHQVTVVTLFGTRTDFYRLPEGVRRRALDIAGESPTVLHAIRNNLRRLRKLRQAVRSTRPDVVISFQDRTNVLTSLSVLGTGYTLIATEHLDPSMVPGGRVWKWLRRLTYPRLAKVVSVSLGVDQYFGWLPESQRSVIYNPLTPIERVRDSAGVPAGADPSKKWIVAMGRLAHQKGFDLLLSAFHM